MEEFGEGRGIGGARLLAVAHALDPEEEREQRADPVDIDFQLEKPKEENIVVRVQKPIKERLERIARRKGLNISSLTRMWIMEKLQAAQ